MNQPVRPSDNIRPITNINFRYLNDWAQVNYFFILILIDYRALFLIVTEERARAKIITKYGILGWLWSHILESAASKRRERLSQKVLTVAQMESDQLNTTPSRRTKSSRQRVLIWMAILLSILGVLILIFALMMKRNVTNLPDNIMIAKHENTLSRNETNFNGQ